MCGGQKYCRENGILTVHVGESVITADVHSTYTGFRNPMKRGDKAYRHVPDGATILICEVPEQIRKQYGVESMETVKFVEINEKPHDLVKFEKVEKPVPLKEFGFNVRFDILALKDQPAPDPDSQFRLPAKRVREKVAALTTALFGFLWV